MSQEVNYFGFWMLRQEVAEPYSQAKYSQNFKTADLLLNSARGIFVISFLLADPKTPQNENPAHFSCHSLYYESSIQIK